MHTERTSNRPAGRTLMPFVVQFDQAVRGHALQLWPQVAEVTAKVDVERLFDLAKSRLKWQINC